MQTVETCDNNVQDFDVIHCERILMQNKTLVKNYVLTALKNAMNPKEYIPDYNFLILHVPTMHQCRARVVSTLDEPTVNRSLVRRKFMEKTHSKNQKFHLGAFWPNIALVISLNEMHLFHHLKAPHQEILHAPNHIPGARGTASRMSQMRSFASFYI